MNLLVKSDLEYTYSWTAIDGDDPKISGIPDNTLFNRNEGYEDLYLINKFANIHSLNQKKSGKKIEKMIKKYDSYIDILKTIQNIESNRILKIKL